jgi:hypothetical protein
MQIEIRDFCMNGSGEFGIDRCLEADWEVGADVGGFSDESFTPNLDVRTFAGLFEVLMSTSTGQGGCDLCIPSFVSEIIERGQSADRKT